MNFGTTSLAAPHAVSLRVARYSFTARLDLAGSRSLRQSWPAIERCLFASVAIRLASTANPSPPTRPAAMHVSTIRSDTRRGTPPSRSARCGRARTPNDPGQRPRCRACRTSDRRGSPALHGRSTVPSGSQRDTPRPASESSVPDRSTGAPSTNSEMQVHREARTDREQHRSSVPDDLPEPRRQDETRRTVDLGHSSDGPSWIDLAEIRVNTTESRFAACLNRLLQQNQPLADSFVLVLESPAGVVERRVGERSEHRM